MTTAEVNPRQEAHTSIWGQLTNASAVAQQVLGSEKQHLTGMLSFSVEKAGMFLAFPLSHGVRS